MTYIVKDECINVNSLIVWSVPGRLFLRGGKHASDQS